MDGHGLLDHQTVLDQLPDVLPGVRVGDLVDLVRVQPHLGQGHGRQGREVQRRKEKNAGDEEGTENESGAEGEVEAEKVRLQ